MANAPLPATNDRPTPKRPKKNPRSEDVIDLGKLDRRAFINKRQIIASAYPVSDATLWRRIKAGEFPEPVTRGGLALWRVGDVIDHLEAQGGAA